jgi:thioredoxin-like negative regulator of GroEL
MQARQSITVVMLGVALLLPTACQNVQPSKNATFKSKYLVARGALEEGNYSRASHTYQALLTQAGPLASRMRLEYAHSLIRDNRFEDASREARTISENQTGDARIAALTVQATADHELARAAMARGERDKAVRNRLQSASKSLDEVLKKGKAFDPLGSMAERRRIIKKELASL